MTGLRSSALGALDFLTTFFSVVKIGGGALRLEILASDATHGYHHPRPTPTANKIVLKWDSNGCVDLSPLKEYGFGEEVDGRRVVKTWCQAICPVTNMSKWSWKMQMTDLFGVLLKRTCLVLF